MKPYIFCFLAAAVLLSGCRTGTASAPAADEKVLAARAAAALLEMKPSPDKTPVVTPDFTYYTNIDGKRARRNKGNNAYTLYLPQGMQTVCCEQYPGTDLCAQTGLAECE